MNTPSNELSVTRKWLLPMLLFSLFGPSLAGIGFVLLFTIQQYFTYAPGHDFHFAAGLITYIGFSYAIATVPILISAVLLLRRREENLRIPFKTAIRFSFILVTFWVVLLFVYVIYVLPELQTGELANAGTFCWISGFCAAMICCGLNNVLAGLFLPSHLQASR